MARIEPLDPPYDPAVQQSLDRLMPPGMEPLRLFRTAAHNPRVLRSMQRGGLLDPGSVSVRQREIAILRTCALCGADYEWGVHAALFAEAGGLSPDVLQATTATENPADGGVLAPDERLVVELCDRLHARATIDDALFARLRAHFSEAQLLELTALAGLYHAVSYLVNVAGVEPEPFAKPPPHASTRPAPTQASRA